MNPKSPKGFEHIQKILGHAMRAADPSTWPERPHFGGPLVVLTTRSQLGVAIGLCDGVQALVPTPDPEAFADTVAVARRVRDGEQIEAKRLDPWGTPSKRDPPAMRVAKLAIRAASNFLYSPPSARNAVGTAVENAARSLVPILAERGPEAVADYLAWLDDLVMRHELAQHLAERSLAISSPLARIVSRVRTDKGTLGAVMARLTDGSYGLYVKLKARWEWHEGDRASVFATVPDALMDAVVRDLEASA